MGYKKAGAISGFFLPVRSVLLSRRGQHFALRQVLRWLRRQHMLGWGERDVRVRKPSDNMAGRRIPRLSGFYRFFRDGLGHVAIAAQLDFDWHFEAARGSGGLDSGGDRLAGCLRHAGRRC